MTNVLKLAVCLSPSHGRGHRFDPCAAHHLNQRLTDVPRYRLDANKCSTTQEHTHGFGANPVQRFADCSWGQK